MWAVAGLVWKAMVAVLVTGGDDGQPG
jgi:hypothetical protein